MGQLSVWKNICLAFICGHQFIFGDQAHALGDKFQKSLWWEFHANSGNRPRRRAQEKFHLKYYEVPVSLLDQLEGGRELASVVYEEGLSPDIKDSLLFTKHIQGQDKAYIRWVINPEDTYYHQQVSHALRMHGYQSAPQQGRFHGYLTSSRSMYVEDVVNGAIFSIKVSTTRTGGSWHKKKHMDHAQVLDSKLTTELALRIQKVANFKHLLILPETFGAKINSSSVNKWTRKKFLQGLVVRDISLLADEEHYYLPGFAALHEKVGREIARYNGSSRPRDFWIKNYIDPLARASAEFSAYFGMSVTSSHSQQFLVQLDRNYRPTGKIVFRDFNDGIVLRPAFESAQEQEDKDFFRSWEGIDKSYVRPHLRVMFGVFHGTKVPSWFSMSAKQYDQLVKRYFDCFEETFSSITGVSRLEMQRKRKIGRKPQKYSERYYTRLALFRKKSLWTQGWRRYFKFAECFRGADVAPNGQSCAEVREHLSSMSRHPYSKEKDKQELLRELSEGQNLSSSKEASLKKTLDRIFSKNIKPKESVKEKTRSYFRRWF